MTPPKDKPPASSPEHSSQNQPPENIAVILRPGQRLAAFSVRKGGVGSVWVRTGSAEVHADGSISVTLARLPLDGRLQLRSLTDGDCP